MKNIFKKCMAFVIAGAMTLAFVGTTVFAGDVTQKSITVNGTGIVKVKPDICDISFTVQTNNKASDVSQQENIKITENVMTALKNMGIDSENIITSGYTVYPEYYYNEETHTSTITGYNTTNRFTVTTKQIDKAGEIVQTAINAGATRSSGVSFYVEDTNKYYGEALKSAILNASNSGKYIAEALGVNITSVLSVEEMQSSNSYENYKENSIASDMAMSENAGGGAASPNITYDDIEISANVIVVYGY